VSAEGVTKERIALNRKNQFAELPLCSVTHHCVSGFREQTTVLEQAETNVKKEERFWAKRNHKNVSLVERKL
jgi:hypothetical protein